jgi:acyl-CoA reductase-like NAD-dependent aldehyde dehydrogenase
MGAYHARMAIAEDLEVAAFLKGQPKKLFIGGRWTEAASGKTFESIDPATGAVLARVAEAGVEDVDRAVAAARRSFDSGVWRDLPPAERAKALWKIGDMIEERATEFAQLETLDNGMPINDALLFHAPLAAATFRYYAGWVTKLDGATQQVSLPGKYLSYTLREPVGVVGQIIPWNFPLLMAAWKLAPALACGNSVVLKPSEETPLSALLLAELMQQAEVPDGVVNVVPGFGETAGARLASHPDVDKIAFTGSTEVGKLITKASAESNLKRVSLELGGKSPNIVFADADLGRAVSGAFFGIFFNQGQVCSAGSRLFVQEKLYDQALDELLKTVRETRIGPGIDPITQMGPLVSKTQMERVLGYITVGNREGARMIAGGGRPEGLDGGYFVEPTVFADVDGKMRIAREEIFGPVVSAIPFADEDDLVAKANSTIYGLVAGVWTRDVARAHRVAHALKAGTVYVNCYHIVDPVTPWGGFKQSGWGRELGPYALDLYTELKNVIVDIA